MCSVIKQSFKLCRWFQSNTCLQSVVNGAKVSFHSFLNRVELQMNLMSGMTEPLKILVITDASHAMAIKESFSRELSGQVIISRCQVEDHRAPLLPVGYDSALQLAQSKVNSARQKYNSERSSIIVTTIKFIEEIYPQRWQLLTLLWLDDPNLNLILHNFTATIPVPNDYVNCAQKLTPDNYPFKRLGLAVTLEEAIEYATVTIISKDAEEILCGINQYDYLKSASDILAGMYSGYVNRFAL